jgi:hypothetical protein
VRHRFAKAYFKDPFSGLRGLPSARFMYASLEHPHFVVTGIVDGGGECS